MFHFFSSRWWHSTSFCFLLHVLQTPLGSPWGIPLILGKCPIFPEEAGIPSIARVPSPSYTGMYWVMGSRPVSSWLCFLVTEAASHSVLSIQGISTTSFQFHHELCASWVKWGEVGLWVCGFVFLLLMATVSPWLPHLFAMSLSLLPGLATVGTAYSGQSVASPTLWAAGRGLQPGSSTTTSSVGATESAWLHLAPPSLSFPLPTSPAYCHIPTFRGLDVWISHMFVCWWGYPLLNYSCVTYCDFKGKSKGVFSLCHET